MLADVVTINLRFGVQTSLGLYQDTIVFSEAEWTKRDIAAIEKSKQALADTWVIFMTAQIAEAEAMRTADGKRARIAEIDGKIADLTATKDGLQSELDINGQ